MKNLTSAQKELEELSIVGLRERFVEVLGYGSLSRSRCFLIRKILWGMQVSEHGDIEETLKQRALALADDRDARSYPPGGKPINPSGLSKVKTIDLSSDPRLPVAGAILTRAYKGRDIRVLVLDHGFEWEGRFYKSLSSIAGEVTGTKWNGFGFFGLLPKKES